MKLAVICFTKKGALIGRRLYTYFKAQGVNCEACVPERFLEQDWKADGMKSRGKENLTQWSGRQFSEKNAMIFIGAAGIAVRAAAPWIRDKFADPPVIVIDETARFVIPLLSGHVGGANELACELAAFLGAVPVITTATDRNGLFAVDLFAAGNGLVLTDRKMAREISARILEGKTVGFISDFPTDGGLCALLAGVYHLDYHKRPAAKGNASGDQGAASGTAGSDVRRWLPKGDSFSGSERTGRCMPEGGENCT